MKTITKLKKNSKALAGTALLLGATVVGGAAMASAQDNGNLGEYPNPMIDEDGEVDTSIVVGDEARTIDVVGAINVAGSLGQSAYSVEEQSVEVQGSPGWSAENGFTLNRPTSNLFLGDTLAIQEDLATSSELDALADTMFQNENNDDVEVTQEVQVGDAGQNYDTSVRGLDDPALYVDVPYRSDVGVDTDYALQFTAEMDEQTDFTNTDEMDGEEIELFGNSFTVNAEDTEQGELHLYGSSQEFGAETGESETFTVAGNEHTVDVRFVAEDSNTATIRVNGEADSYSESETFRVSGQEVRIRSIVPYGDGDGLVRFAIGSEEIVLNEGGNVEVDGDRVRGTDVNLEGDTDGDVSTLDSITVATGTGDRDARYIEAGSSYEDPVFGTVHLHYGGLNTNAAENPAEMVNVAVQNEDEAEISFMTDNDEELDVTWETVDNSGTLGDLDGQIATYEGQPLVQDDFTVLNEDEQAAMYEVTDAFIDSQAVDSQNDAEVELVLENIGSGNTVEIEETVDSADYSGQTVTLEDERINRVRYDVTFHTKDSAAAPGSLEGDEAAVQVERASLTRGTEDSRVLYPAMYTETDHATAFTDQVTIEPSDSSEAVSESFGSTATYNDFTGDGEDPETYTADTAEAVEYTAESGDDYDRLEFNFDISGPSDGDTVDIELTIDSTTHTANEVALDTNGDATVQKSDFTNDLSSVDGELNTDVAVTGNSADITELNQLDLSSLYESGQAASAQYNVRLPSTKSSGEYEVSFDDSTTANTVLGEEGQFELEVVSADTTSAEVRPSIDSTAYDSPAAHVFEPQDDNDMENVFTFTTDGGDPLDLSAVYSGGEGDSDSGDTWWTDSWDSEDDFTTGYTTFGTYTEWDSSDEGDMTLNLVAAQSTTGAAVTGEEGSLSATGGSASQSVETMMPTGWPDTGALDVDVNIDQRVEDEHTVLVGGPAVNTLVADLASEGLTWEASEYSEDEAIIQHIPDAFEDGQDAIVVAGYSGEDTREAANYLANYADHADELAGQSTVTLQTGQ